MALSENYRTETIGRSDCRPIVRLSADTIVRWDYRPNPSFRSLGHVAGIVYSIHHCHYHRHLWLAPLLKVNDSFVYTPHSYGTLPAIWHQHHTVLPANRHR